MLKNPVDVDIEFLTKVCILNIQHAVQFEYELGLIRASEMPECQRASPNVRRKIAKAAEELATSFGEKGKDVEESILRPLHLAKDQQLENVVPQSLSQMVLGMRAEARQAAEEEKRMLPMDEPSQTSQLYESRAQRVRMMLMHSKGPQGSSVTEELSRLAEPSRTKMSVSGEMRAQVIQSGTEPEKSMLDKLKEPDMMLDKQQFPSVEVEERKERGPSVSGMLHEEIQQRLPRRPSQRAISQQSIDLFGSPGLGIFPLDYMKQARAPEDPFKMEIWEKMHQKELQLAITHPPVNAFEELILLTYQGKLWPFPIDNEFGLDEEKVGFQEHVFLEKHLEDWCPAKGPVRHFMELVCVGLSKNPFITVQYKEDTILWYRDFFDAKRGILEKTGAVLPS
ncbi:unnamed protein product [Darwinula stevensoni]|uniref:Small ribosomal subunit protein mS31 n=1 Tax=Darwinula stevensoni TaxID=69355 RepID=A0A7R8X1K6_9CRUS|nr:unnamed protein product [Darwinula stevensoni]CAG0882892.1 unnamed protein product [Darwinula stevensoni]